LATVLHFHDNAVAVVGLAVDIVDDGSFFDTLFCLLFVEVLQVSDDPFSFQQAVQEINEEHLSVRSSKDSLEAPIREWRDALLHILFVLVYYFLQKYGLFLNDKIFFVLFLNNT
jgi:hypothetical protein